MIAGMVIKAITGDYRALMGRVNAHFATIPNHDRIMVPMVHRDFMHALLHGILCGRVGARQSSLDRGEVGESAGVAT
jgi:hypothetical protein